MAAPIASQVFGEVLPYLEVYKKESDEERSTVTVPNIENISIKEAEKVLKDVGLEMQIDLEEGIEIDKENTVIIEQLPKEGIKLNSGTKVFVKIQ